MAGRSTDVLVENLSDCIAPCAPLGRLLFNRTRSLPFWPTSESEKRTCAEPIAQDDRASDFTAETSEGCRDCHSSTESCSIWEPSVERPRLPPRGSQGESLTATPGQVPSVAIDACVFGAAVSVPPLQGSQSARLPSARRRARQQLLLPKAPPPPESSRVSMTSSTFAHCVAAGAYSLDLLHPEEETKGLSVVAPLLRDRNLARTVGTWDAPVRLYTESLGHALGIDWTKYMDRLEAESSTSSAPSSARGGAPCGGCASSAGAGGTAPNSARGSGDTSARKRIAYTRDGRRIDNTMRSDEEANLIERVQGHSCLTPPSASHPSVAKYVGEDGTALITPGSTGITPRSVAGLTPRSSITPRSTATPRSNGITPRDRSVVTPRSPGRNPRAASNTPRSGTLDGHSLAAALAPAAFGLASAGVSGEAAEGNAQSQASVKAVPPDAVYSKRHALQGNGGASVRNKPISRRSKLEAASRRTGIRGASASGSAGDVASWRDNESFRKTHIDYSCFLQAGAAASLRDLQATAIRIAPGSDRALGSGTSGAGTVGAMRGGVSPATRKSGV